MRHEALGAADCGGPSMSQPVLMRTSKPSLVLPLMLLLGCPGDGGDDDGGVAMYCKTCDLAHWLPALAVDGARDCGFMRLHGDATAVIACVDDALAHDTPFMARQELQGIDSRVEFGFLVDQDGVVQQLFYDANICGSITCEEGCGPTVIVTECRNPRRAALPEQSLVDCEAGESAVLCGPAMVE
jgi:hypothetical protein